MLARAASIFRYRKHGYNVVATLASGAEGLPIRFSSTLRPGQRVVISVPQAIGEPSVNFEIIRDGDVLLVSEPVTAPVDEMTTAGVADQ
ncbi:hypothetical protein RFN28_24125 [Mesorhizobium sp. VK24D]|uniref:Uncharacterized protein n=1 Tax=Mesorhizobium album TaxID=3072314 RepID=A0ABU4Y3L0_9HYPH|nr:hypothetical protein [Mesorhizobium sp. VK24D]MDX8481525.1 hypothetical protein [Mesorhizobium sp. VK24D]